MLVNPELNLGFGHPDILLRLVCTNQLNAKRERKQTLDDLDTNLPYYRVKRRYNFYHEENKK